MLMWSWAEITQLPWQQTLKKENEEKVTGHARLFLTIQTWKHYKELIY